MTKAICLWSRVISFKLLVSRNVPFAMLISALETPLDQSNSRTETNCCS